MSAAWRRGGEPWLGSLLVRCLRPAAHIAASLLATGGLVGLTAYVTATSHSASVIIVSLLGLTAGAVMWGVAGRIAGRRPPKASDQQRAARRSRPPA
jgi:VIT1/CCC1 family predicted Fe2+/Mn2+ transporter